MPELPSWTESHLLPWPTQTDIMPVTMRMRTANDDGINITGAVLLRMSSKDYHGQLVETRQMTYVTDPSDKLFRSREACITLGIIKESFLVTHGPQGDSAAAVQGESVSPCDCLRHRQPPPPPTTVPIPATETIAKITAVSS